MTPEEHLAKIDAVAQRPLLSDPDDRALFYFRLVGQFTREINRAKKGKPTTHPLSDLQWLISELNSRIKNLKGESYV